MTEIRKALKSDLPCVFILLKELGYYSESNTVYESIWEKILNDPSMGVLVAITEGKLSGYLSYSFKPQLRAAGIILEIDELCVAHQYRGLGLGTKFINEIKELSARNKFKRIVLSTNKQRESYTRGFYAKNGFQEKDSALLICNLP